MKSKNLKSVKATLVAVVILGACSCHSNSSQSTDSVKNNDSAINSASSSTVATNSTNNTQAGDNGNTNNNSSSNNATHSWLLVITPSTTKSELDSTVAVWKRENINLDISKVKYDANNKLVKINGTVTINRRNGSHASGEFKSENLSIIQIKVDDSPNVSIKGN